MVSRPKLTPDAAYRLAKALLKSGGPRDPRLEAVVAGDPELFYGYEQELEGKPAGYIASLHPHTGIGRIVSEARANLLRQFGGDQFHSSEKIRMLRASPLLLYHLRNFPYWPDYAVLTGPGRFYAQLANED